MMRWRRRPALSIISLVHEPPERVELLTAPFSGSDRELVLAADDRVPAAWLDGYRRIADRLLVVTFPGAFAYLYSWLVGNCRGRWIFHIDDDEVPSTGLAAEVEATIADDDVSHAWVARRWLWPDGRSYLTDAPWSLDLQPRLFRNDPATLRLPSEPHEQRPPLGARAELGSTLWHAHLLLRSYEARVERGRELERRRPGVTVGGAAINEAYYLPERAERPLATSELPVGDSARVASYLVAGERHAARDRR